MRQKTFMDPGRQWDRTVELWKSSGMHLMDFMTIEAGGFPDLAVVVANHKVFSVGDVVLIRSFTGACRYEVIGKTRKGRDVRGMWVTTQERWYGKKTGHIKRVEWPGHLVGKRLDDPGTRRFAIEIAHAHAPHSGPARPVGVSVDNPTRLP